MTIHGFCQSLLKRFPLEAGVVPHFDVLDPRSAADLLREAQAEVLASRSAGIQRALGRLAVLLGETTLAEGLTALREDRLRLGALITDQGVEALIARIEDALGLAPGAGAGEVRRAACIDPEIDRRALLDAARILAAGTDKEAERAQIIADWLTAEVDQRRRTWEGYATVFLTKERKSRQTGSIVSKACAAAAPAAEAALLAEQARLRAWVEREKAATVAERTAALLRVGAAVLSAYDRRKRELAALDFDDLIAASRRLLDQPGIASWVQYKLDQQIDHLLVDEGQDTSPEQWAIILALSAEFFTGEGARPIRRTLFVVGDEKQSIMSVQGADVATYRRFREVLEARAGAGRQPWREEPLGRSFRSAKPILDLVDAVFADPEARDGVVSGDDWPAHECFRTTAPGLVEVWPLIEGEPAARTEDWQLPDRLERRPSAARPASPGRSRGRSSNGAAIAVPLASTGQPIRAGDVMVLLPRRGILQELLIRELKRLQVPVAGADRLALTDELAVMDLMALGDALLLPEDDLTLAAVLRSPLFGLGEEDLFELAHGRGDARLIERLRAFRHRSPRLGEALGALFRAPAPGGFRAAVRVLCPPAGCCRRSATPARAAGSGGDRADRGVSRPGARLRAGPPALPAGLPALAQGGCDRADPRPRPAARRGPGADLPRRQGPRGADRVHRGRLLRARLQGPAAVARARRPAALADGRQRPRRPQRGGQRPRSHAPAAGAAPAALRRPDAGEGAPDRHRLATQEPVGAHLVRAGRRGHGAARCSPGAGRARTGPDRREPLPRQPAGARPGPAPPGARPQGARTAAAPGLGPTAGADRAPRAAPLSPSRAFEDEAPAATSPAQGAASGRFRRGRLIHRLLQSLPERPPAERAPALARYLAERSLGLAEAEQAEIAAEVLSVLAMPELAPLFGPDARAEVPLVGVVGEQAIFGQVDRLAVTPEAVLLLDYKTNRSPPSTPAEVPGTYLRQMAAYRALLEAIWPDRPVRCALLWTEGPRLMTLDDRALAPWRPGGGHA